PGQGRGRAENLTTSLSTFRLGFVLVGPNRTFRTRVEPNGMHAGGRHPNRRRSRPALVAVVALAALLFPAWPSHGGLPSLPGLAGLRVEGPAAVKLSPALRGILEHGLTDTLSAPVVDGHVPGTVYALAQVRSVDPTTLRVLEAAGATIRHRFDLIGWVAIAAPAAAIVRVAGLDAVTRVVEDRVLHTASLTATPLTAVTGFPDQRERGQFDIGADRAWDAGITGTGVTIGVVDSGIDSSHPDLAPKLGTFVNCMGVLPDLTSDSATASIGQCLPSPGIDDNGHGTHVAGIAAGGGIANNQLPGVAPSASLVGAKVCNAAGSCLNSSVLAGIQQLATPVADGGAGAQVINLSLGATPAYGAGVFLASQETDADPEAQLIDTLADKYGVVFAIAAGHAGPTLQSVGSPSTASVYAISTFSSRGPSGDRQIKPDVTAPGSYIVSAEALTGAEVKAADLAV